MQFLKQSFRVSCIVLLLGSGTAMAAQEPGWDDVVGFWKSVDKRAGFTTSILAVYRSEEALHGRLIVAYSEHDGSLIDTMEAPLQRIERYPGQPYLLATDLFWDLTAGDGRYGGGRIIDPRSGNTYRCEIWRDGPCLIVRGLLGPFGLNSRFYQAGADDFPVGFTIPNLQAMTPCPP